MKNNNGITLIALVITIIIMLILIAVTIRIASDGNLFKHAANATSKTKAEAERENAMINDELDPTISNIVGEQTTETPTVTLIHFTIAGTPYDAEEGMTWEDWIANTNYNTNGFKPDGLGGVLFRDGEYVKSVRITDTISNNGVYVGTGTR